MADNVTLNLGSGGAVAATDDVGGFQHQRVKLSLGADGSATDALGGAGAVAAGVQRVTLASDDPLVAKLAAVAHDGAATANAPTLVGGYASAAAPTDVSADGDAVRAWHLRNGANVVQPSFAGVLASVGNGVSGTGVLRVAQVSDGTGVLATVTNVATIGTSVTPGTAAAHLGKAEDAAHASGDVGVMALAVRNDAGTSLVSATGDYTPLSTDSSGALRVVGSSGTTQYTEDGASAGGESLCLMGAVRRDTAASSSGTDGDYSTLNTDANGNLRVALSAGGVSGVVDDAAVTVATTEVMMIGFMADEASTDSVNEGDGGMARMTLDRKVIVTPYAHDAAGGATPFKLVSTASTNATSLKAAPGKLLMLTLTNKNAATRSVKFYNQASSPTVGTDVPVLTFEVPGNTAGAGIVVPIPSAGIQFTTGIAYATTTENTDGGSTAVASGDVVMNGAYI